jgi:cytochrome P450
VNTPHSAQIAGNIDPSQNEFWAQPPAQRHTAFAQLRALGSPPHFADPEGPIPTDGRGFYALVRHSDVAGASRNPEVFSSARGATSLIDLPAEFNEYFGSMISMDDPRHARLRRIVSRAFTPKMIRKFEEEVQRTAAGIVGELLITGD